MDSKLIGIFDSGVGGLTVYKEIKKVNPNLNFIYLGDTKHFPYGSKTKENIIELSRQNIDFLISKKVDEIVIACGTATSQALETLKKEYKILINGIIEPTAEYIKEKEYNKVGIMATRGTIKSKAFENEIKKKSPDIEVQNKACPLLAPMAEEGWTNNEVAELTIKEYIKEFKDIQAIVLGCTHYPLFENIIKKYMPEVDVINTGKIVAENMKKRLKVDSKTDKIKEDKFYLTDTESNFINVAKLILNKEIVIEEIKEV